MYSKANYYKWRNKIHMFFSYSCLQIHVKVLAYVLQTFSLSKILVVLSHFHQKFFIVIKIAGTESYFLSNIAILFS